MDEREREKIVSMRQKTRKIEKLTQELSALKEQRDKLKAEAREWAEKRNKFNEQNRNLHTKIRELRNERDELNEKVKELKQMREKTKTEVCRKIGELRKLNQEFKVLVKKEPSRSLEALQNELEKIEWEIQTTPLSLREEKELVEQVKQLETQLNIHRKIGKLSQKILEFQVESKALETKSKSYHEKLIETAKKSQEIHQKMLEKIEEAKKLQMEADNMHQNFLQTRRRTKPVQEKMTEISDQIKILKTEVRREEEKEKKKTEEVLREKIEKQAREKLKRGEKLTWQEFQILAEKEMTTQD